jgi:hypothetical protein
MLSLRARFIVLMGFALITGTAHPVVAQGPPEGFPDLVSGLRAIEGNLGVETAQTSSGKQVIFAWFKDKESVLRWYHSDMHRGAQDMFFPNRPEHEPLAHVPDDVGPILAIASITPADSAQFATTSLPISQIAIELYAPLPGGLSLGGTFAPAALEVPHMIDLGPAGEHEHPEKPAASPYR